MSHFAKIDKNNIVTEVIVAEQNEINSEVFGDSFEFVQTSYNGNFRGKFASIGDIWDIINNKFIPPKPFDSWLWNENNYQWEAPVENTVSPNNQITDWNEETQSWDEATAPEE